MLAGPRLEGAVGVARVEDVGRREIRHGEARGAGDEVEVTNDVRRAAPLQNCAIRLLSRAVFWKVRSYSYPLKRGVVLAVTRA